jgi:nucleoside-diphosphate-sugar epimerase
LVGEGAAVRVLITGGAGFVGSQLGLHLHRRGDEVVLIDNMSFGHLDNLLHEGAPFGRFICADVRDDIDRHLEGVDTVFHFAGIAALPVCQQDPGAAYANNTAAVGNVLEAARRADVRRVIFSSTSAVYENSAGGPFAEDASIAPDLVYACTKAAAEQVCTAYAANYGMDIIVCRFFNVYGPHQDVLRASPPFTSYLSREFVLGRSPRVFNWTDARRDYVYVDDLVDVLVRMRDAEGTFKAEQFNVCSGEGFTVPEIYEHFQAVSGSNIEPVRQDPEKYWDAYPILFEGRHPLSRKRITKEVFKNAIGNPGRTKEQFGWTAKTQMRDGIAAVYEDAKRRLTR